MHGRINAACLLHLPREDFIFIISPAISGKTQPDATWRTRHQLRQSKETMDNSFLAVSVHGAGRQQAACKFLLWNLLKESLSPCTRRRSAGVSLSAGEGKEGGG